MKNTQTAGYAGKTTAYLASPRGQAGYRESRERFGYSERNALRVAVMAATRLRTIGRIDEVAAAVQTKGEWA